MQWAGLLNGTRTALYVRSCGQVESGTEGCDHTAGVCGVVVSLVVRSERLLLKCAQ